MHRFALVAIVCAAVGCARPGRLDRIAPVVFPFPVDTQRAERVAPGVIHRFVYSSAGPWAIHVLDVDRDACNSAIAVKGFPDSVGRKKTSVLLTELDSMGTVVGGVNADFFRPNGAPTNAHVSRGRVLSRPSDRPVLAFDSTGAPHILRLTTAPIGDVSENDGGLRLTPLHPLEAVGGRPVLARDSTVLPQVDSGAASFSTSRHPRTAAGIARGGRRLLLVTVDGRQSYSDGMTLRELANVMLALGARAAINLDGGGSTAMVVKSPATGRLTVANRPSDQSGERAVGNALAVVRGCNLRR
jgi:hypothetical protein